MMTSFTKGPIELRLGRYQDVLADVSPDAVICDPPYNDRTHSVYREMASIGRRAINYDCWGKSEIVEFCSRWQTCPGWVVILTDHHSFPGWESSLDTLGRYVFSPLACVEPGKRVRLSGDGPAQWSVWACVSRPKNRTMQRWGALPGAYVVPSGQGWRARADQGGTSGITGGKPLWLMRAIVRDYTRPGDLVLDPVAGGGTTLLAAAMEGRKAIGAEMDPATYALACKRIDQGWTRPMFSNN